jgi:hypothetical protein
VAIEQRNRARHALQRIRTRAQQSQESPSEQQLTHALYLLTLGRPATAQERQDGEKLLKAAAQRETVLAEWIDRLQKHPDYSKSLAEARLQLQDFRVEMARDRDLAVGRTIQAARSREELPIHAATKTIMTTIKPLDQRAGLDLMFLMSIGQLPHAKYYAEVEKQLQPPKPNYAQVQLSDYWWALLNSNEFAGGPSQP